MAAEAGMETATEAEDNVHWAFHDQEEMPDEDGGPGEAGGGGGDLRSPCLECHTRRGGGKECAARPSHGPPIQ